MIAALRSRMAWWLKPGINATPSMVPSKSVLETPIGGVSGASLPPIIITVKVDTAALETAVARIRDIAKKVADLEDRHPWFSELLAERNARR